MPQINVPTAYRGPTQGQPEITARGATVRECLDDAGRQFPGFAEQIFDSGGKVQRFVTLFLNGEEIDRGDVDVAIAETDSIEILVAVAGG
ncbi:MAG: MoaD/ThiS family protein [Deltaproteobacteria bacterium]|nr:MoaD/ThiS family protein [Deltaproteobacteria bacterium]MBW2359525.1 MoaD/ThiS family protein [Deltaproteobacteria bacterium]